MHSKITLIILITEHGDLNYMVLLGKNQLIV